MVESTDLSQYEKSRGKTYKKKFKYAFPCDGNLRHVK